MQAIEQYLARYAEPEARLEALAVGTYERVLVVPVRREAPSFMAGYESALEAADGRTLVVVIVNACSTDAESCRIDNEQTVSALCNRARRVDRLADSPPVMLLQHERFDVLLVDRSSAPFALPAKQGVGLARRIGADLALALIQRGRIASPWIFFSDADVELPRTYFSISKHVPEAAIALTLPFVHAVEAVDDPTSDSGPSLGSGARHVIRDLHTATALYEISLRYYVLGLSWARSPYAFHTLGSALSVRADGYARVRGVPRRLAGEDFHLLAKLAKVGGVGCPDVDAVRIRVRESDRVPFGTGPAVARLKETELRLFPPYTFTALRAWLERLDAFAEDPRLDLLQRDLPLTADVRRRTRDALEACGAFVAAGAAAAAAPRGRVLRRRLHTWFDALRTLRFIHAVRDSDAPNVLWYEALRRAPFISLGFTATDVTQACLDLQCLERQERARSGWGELRGPAIL